MPAGVPDDELDALRSRLTGLRDELVKRLVEGETLERSWLSMLADVSAVLTMLSEIEREAP